MKAVRKLRETNIALVKEAANLPQTRIAFVNPVVEGISSLEQELLDSAQMDNIQNDTGAFLFVLGFSALGGPDQLG